MITAVENPGCVADARQKAIEEVEGFLSDAAWHAGHITLTDATRERGYDDCVRRDFYEWQRRCDKLAREFKVLVESLEEE